MLAAAMRRRAERKTSCGVVVTDRDGARLLLGRPPQSRLWDIPKGIAAPGEDFARAASRELAEETGLRAEPAALLPLGVHRYRPEKDLALFLWRPEAMPDPATLRCRSVLRLPSGARVPEFATFALLPWEEALGRVWREASRRAPPLPSRCYVRGRCSAM
jgi:8-oxo-dGTP pyrophosphatase MutT (NUDIX family)